MTPFQVLARRYVEQAVAEYPCQPTTQRAAAAWWLMRETQIEVRLCERAVHQQWHAYREVFDQDLGWLDRSWVRLRRWGVCACRAAWGIRQHDEQIER